jgi:alpha-glucosidase
LPIPQLWRGLSVADQEKNSESTLNLYRSALAIRREHLVGTGDITWVNRGESDLLSFARGEYAIYLNAGKETMEIPSVGKLSIGSNSNVVFTNGILTLPPATSAWVAIR